MPTRKTRTEKSKPGAAPKPFLCGTQELVADAVAEMLTTGSSDCNLKLLMDIVIDHNWRRRFGSGINEDGHVTDYPEREARRMLDELAVARVKRTKLAIGERPEPSDIVGRIREFAREECAENLQELLDIASPEECRFISSLMTSYRSAHAGEAGYGDMGLASAFWEQISQREEYMRVPRCLLNDMYAYLEALIKAYPNGKPKEKAA